MTDGKMVVLKPVVWNDNGYIWPAGIATTGGYSKQHGYGHEEWNGRSDWVWEGWKVFHTQGKGEMHRYASDGRLGIIMTTMREKKFYAVGAGCNVFQNTDEDNAAIARTLGLLGYADRMWEVATIRDAKKGKRRDFDRHWRHHMHVNWRCPQTHYAWFDEPVLIEPNKLIPSRRGHAPRQAIVKMHSSYQAVRPDQALSIIRQRLPDEHPVIAWLSTGSFDPVRNKVVESAPPPPRGTVNSASTATDPVIRYMQMYEIVVSPLHHRLQSDFVVYLKEHGIRRDENVDRVDLTYRDPQRGIVLVEVKPTEATTIRYAIRAAMGQLLDYRQRASKELAMLIVVDDEPGREDKDLALLNGFGIAWRSGHQFAFAWPAS